MAIIFVLTTLGGVGLLTLAVWPGVLEDVIFSIRFFILSIPILGCWFLLLVGLALWDIGRKPKPTNRRRLSLWSVSVMFTVMGLLWFHVPQWIAFAFCHSEFQAMVDTAPVVEFRGVGLKEVNAVIGPYWVDRYAADRRGGVFFRTGTGPDGISPDEMSYGFAFRPNDSGTPFGNARYHVRHLFGDWYTFEASDDW